MAPYSRRGPAGRPCRQSDTGMASDSQSFLSWLLISRLSVRFRVGASGDKPMKPSSEQLARLKAYYEAKVFTEVEINAVKKKVREGKGVFVVLDARPRDAFLVGHIPGA